MKEVWLSLAWSIAVSQKEIPGSWFLWWAHLTARPPDLCCQLVLFFFLINLFFYWRIIALQNFVFFCQTSTWISHRYTYIPSLLNLPPISLSITLLYRAPVWVSEPNSKFPSVICFTYCNVSFHVTLSMHLTLSSPLPMSISLFCVSVSPLLPYK